MTKEDMNKLLTIIIPTYNMEGYLDTCLSSLILEDPSLMEQLEVLVVNDGSKDRSSEIAHAYEERYPSTFRVVDKENGNYGSCINVGLKIATGKYVKTLDADDYFDTEAFRDFLVELNENDADVFLHYAKTFTPGTDEVWFYGIFPSDFKKDRKEFTMADLLKPERPVLVGMHNITYRTKIFRDLGYHQLEGVSYTDNLWTFLPLSQARTIRLYPHTVYRYLKGREGQTVNADVLRRRFEDERQVSLQMCRDFASSGCDGDGKRYLHDRLKEHLEHIYLHGINGEIYNEPDVRNLDRDIKDIVPGLYREFDNLVVSVYSYHHSVSVRFWRKWDGRWFYVQEGLFHLFMDPLKLAKKLLLKR